jgi:hypothetical protein
MGETRGAEHLPPCTGGPSSEEKSIENALAHVWAISPGNAPQRKYKTLLTLLRRRSPIAH